MKKLLLASMMLSSSIAFAADVTVYGKIDASIASVDKNGVKTTVQGNGDYLGSSVLGFKGTEKIGDSLTAGFRLEGDINASVGSGDGSGGGLTFDRHAYIFVGNKLITVKAGRIQDPVKDTYSLTNASTNMLDAAVSKLSPSLSFGSRVPQSVQVESSLGALSLKLNHSSNIDGDKKGAEGTKQNLLGVQTKVGSLTVLGSYGDRDDETTAYTIGAKVKVAGGTLSGLYAAIDEDGEKSKSYAVATILPLGSDYQVRANYVINDSDVESKDGSQYGVMLEKLFSKRTTAYVGYLNVDSKTDSKDQKIVAVGLLHKF